MNLNPALQHHGFIVWTALAVPSNPAIDLRHHAGFGFTFKVDTDITTDAVFEIRAAPPDAANPCVPGIFHDIAETLICSAPGTVVPAAKSQVVIPVGTKADAVCVATLPCKPDAFVRVFAVSGDTGKVEVVITLSGVR
jgi:hypothetical protein